MKVVTGMMVELSLLGLLDNVCESECTCLPQLLAVRS